MENRNLIIDILNVINTANHTNSRINNDLDFKGCYDTPYSLKIYNLKQEYLIIHVGKSDDNYYLYISSYLGGRVSMSINELDFLDITTSIRKCYKRFNSILNIFCKTFY